MKQNVTVPPQATAVTCLFEVAYQGVGVLGFLRGQSSQQWSMIPDQYQTQKVPLHCILMLGASWVGDPLILSFN